ncbi:MAG: hypothetical protein ABSB01_24780 [Streptosporangiaceae bacterium]|jgi:hypothetical protein
MRIGERVRAAHLSNHCPGGLGFPVTSSASSGADADNAHAASRSWLIVTDHEARAAGEICARCRQEISARQNVRSRGDGNWVHETCPPVPGHSPP